MSLSLKDRLTSHPLASSVADAKEDANPPIIRLYRTYCLLAIGAALLISFCFYLGASGRGGRDAGSAFSGDFGVAANWLGLIMLAGAVVCGFRIARQAVADSRRNAELLHDAKRRTLEIAALYDTTQDVSAKHELQALLQVILRRASTLLGAAGAAIFLYDEERDDFVIAVEAGVGMTIGTHLSRYEGLAGRVAETLEPLIVNEYKHWPYGSKTLDQLPIGAVVCAPMVREGQLIGVLGVHEVGKTERRFTEADARLLTLFADNAAGAVSNARLFDALQYSEERFRIAASCATDIVYDWDLVADRVECFGGLYERSVAKAMRMRQDYWNLVHPEDRDRVRQALDRHFASGQPFSEEYRLGDGKGRFFNVADRATAILNQKGQPIRLIGAVSDITERKQAEQMKSDFVSFVTHQLRTPLSGVKWMLELATDMIDNPEELRSYIQDARTSTDRLIGMVNDLLNISRLERGKTQMNCRDVDLAALTKEVAGEMNPLIMDKEQALSIDAVPDLPAVHVDQQLIRQVLLNLLANAMKYTPAGGKIEICVRRDDNQVFWSVKDTGIGIPKADIGKLFQKFYRAANVLAVETEGTGLGLYLVRLIVERFEGKVWCESEEGTGSTFRFSLPLAQGSK